MILFPIDLIKAAACFWRFVLNERFQQEQVASWEKRWRTPVGRFTVVVDILGATFFGLICPFLIVAGLLAGLRV